MRVGVIISAFNNAAVLRQCLLGYSAQTYRDFEILIADDGSNDSIRALLASDQFRPLKIRHFWHEDQGFRRAKIFNKAIAATDVDYLIMTDADCIPRQDFVLRHVQLAKPRRFVSGGIVDVPVAVHQNFTDDDILQNRVFDRQFLVERDPRLQKYRWRLIQGGASARVLNVLTSRFAVLRGNNSAAWRSDLLAVNGFDESFTKYGSEDRDLGIRLFNAGCWGRMLKYSIVALHLDHARPYYDPEAVKTNRLKFKRKFWTRETWTEPGTATALQRA